MNPRSRMDVQDVVCSTEAPLCQPINMWSTLFALMRPRLMSHARTGITHYVYIWIHTYIYNRINVTPDRGTNLSWYHGPSLLWFRGNASIKSCVNLQAPCVLVSPVFYVQSSEQPMPMTHFKLIYLSLNKLDNNYRVQIPSRFKTYSKLLCTRLKKRCLFPPTPFVCNMRQLVLAFPLPLCILLNLIKHFQASNNSFLKAAFNEKSMFSFHSITTFKLSHKASIIFEDTNTDVGSPSHTKQTLRTIRRCLSK